MAKKKMSVTLFIISLTLTLMVFGNILGTVEAQSSGTYPASTFNGMQITYAITGPSVGTAVDDYSFTTSRTFNGTVEAGTSVTVSGSFHMDWQAFVTGTATVSAGTATQSNTYDLTTNSSRSTADQPFSVTITVPTSGATTCDFGISMSASYGNGESRGLVVSGSFTVEGGLTVDHVTLTSSEDYVQVGDNPVTLTATVWAPGNTQVPDGTPVTFTLADRFGGLGGAYIYPNSASTTSSQVTVYFYPPSASYWDDHYTSDTNRITVTAEAGGKQATYIIYIVSEENVLTDTPTVTPITVTPGGTTNSPFGNLLLPIIVGVVIAVVVVGAVVFLKMRAGGNKVNYGAQYPPPPPPPPSN